MSTLKSFDIALPVKLSAAWAATVLCYIYCDYFALYLPGKVQGILNGKGPFGPVSESTLLGAGVLLIIPCVMVFLAVTLQARINRILNVVFGLVYTLIMGFLATTDLWNFYRLFALIEAALTASIFWMALKWPRTEAYEAGLRS